MIDLPKNPKVSDLVVALVELEEQVTENSARLDRIEASQSAEISRLHAETRRLDWRMRFARRR